MLFWQGLLFFLQTPMYSPKPMELPDWTTYPLQQFSNSTHLDAPVFTVFEEIHFIYHGDNKVEVQYKILREIMQETDSSEAGILQLLNLGHSSNITRIIGWHQRPDGYVEGLKKSNIAIFGNEENGSLTQEQVTVALFERAAKGSILAFEATEMITLFNDPMFMFSLLAPDPVFQKKILWSIDPSVNEGVKGYIRTSNFTDWHIQPQEERQSLLVQGLPGLGSTQFLETNVSYSPHISIGFLNPTTSSYSSWERMSAWYFELFQKQSGIQPSNQVALNKDQIIKLFNALDGVLTYRQIYLSNSRTWVPETGAMVLNRGYGDCKDMVCAWRTKGDKFQVPVFPVFANIYDGPFLNEDSFVGPWFNHLIAAIPLKESFGFGAEVEIGGQRFLLTDPTSFHSRIGFLPNSHRNRSVLICTPSGPIWTQVPDSAFEPEKVLLSLNGTLNEGLSLSGQLQIIEYGNALGLRSTLRETKSLEWVDSVRRILDLPHNLELKAISSSMKDEMVTVNCSVSWPDFLARDAHGFRLPPAIVNRPVFSLKHQKHPNRPVTTPAIPDWTWDLDIQSTTRFQPEQKCFKKETPQYSLIWESTPGDAMRIHFQIKLNSRTYSRTQFSKAVSEWEDFSSNFNRMWHVATLLTPENALP